MRHLATPLQVGGCGVNKSKGYNFSCGRQKSAGGIIALISRRVNCNYRLVKFKCNLRCFLGKLFDKARQGGEVICLTIHGVIHLKPCEISNATC